MRETPSVGETLPARSPDAGARDRGPQARLAAGFAGLAVAVWLLIVLGALVRANDAGLACPDWPLCFGELVPRFDVRVAFEYSHRVLAGSVTLVFAWLSFRAWREPAVRDGTRSAIVVAAVLLGVQIALGALTVWELLASWTVTSHLLTGNGVAVAILWICLSLRETGAPVQRARVARGARTLVLVGALLLVLQIVLGGLVSSRYAGLSCPEWPTCNGGLWFPTLRGPVGLHLLHRLNGYALLLVLALSAWRCRALPRLALPTALLLGLGLAQVLVGITNVLLGLPVEITGLHSALASALVLITALALRESFAARSPAC